MEMSPPILVADQNRTVHAFSSQWINLNDGSSVKAIVYNQWSIDYGWTEPVDILLSPIKEARITDAHLDQKGMMHVNFFGGDGTTANIYYSRAPVDSVDNAQAWSAPVIVGDNASDPENAVFIEDSRGYFYIIYSGRDAGNGLYVVNSQDDGDTWSDPTPIFLTSTDAPSIYQIHAVTGANGWIHVVWNVYSLAGQGRGIYYAQSADGDKWSEPLLLANAQDGLGTQTPNIIEYNGALFAVFNMPPKITMRRSMNNGVTWDDPVILFPRHVGVNGNLALVVDSADKLHLFFGQRITGNPDIHGLWHSIWINDTSRWTEPEAIVKGPQINDPISDKSFDPYDATAVLSRGNVLLVTWRTDPGNKGNGVWYSYKKLSPAQELDNGASLAIDYTEQVPLLTNTPSESNNLISVQQPTQLADLIPPEIFQSGPQYSLSASNSILFSLILVLIFLAFIVVYIKGNKKSS
jgi:hypothetical protein